MVELKRSKSKISITKDHKNNISMIEKHIFLGVSFNQVDKIRENFTSTNALTRYLKMCGSVSSGIPHPENAMW